MKDPRKPAMDIVRCLAFFFVVSVHFFSNIGYYNTPVAGKHMYVMTLLRSFFMICVPLFLMLSGYLTGKKPVSGSYFKKIRYTLAIYLLASGCCALYRILVLKTAVSGWDFVRGVLNYSAAPYAWYVEMYLGLFLLAPFLNVLYNNLAGKREKGLLILVLVLLTALPPMANIYAADWSWFLDPASSGAYVKVLPAFWLSAYPLTYYFLGCWLREYGLGLRPRTLALLNLAALVVNGSFNFYRSHGAAFIWGAWQNYGSLLILVQAVLFFALVDSLDYRRFPERLARILRWCSQQCYGAFLVSWIFDSLVYRQLNAAVAGLNRRFYCYPLAVPCIWICSLLLSWVLDRIYRGLGKLRIKKDRPAAG